MEYNILSYRLSYETKSDTSENNNENNDLLNEYISITKQISRISHLQNDQILEEINDNSNYKSHLFNILISDTPFHKFLKHFTKDFQKQLELYAEIDNQCQRVIENNEITGESVSFKSKEKQSIGISQNKDIDKSMSKIIRVLLQSVKCEMNSKTLICHDVFKVIEESIQDLPLLILSKSINTSHESSIFELKQFVYEIIDENINDWSYQCALEIWLLLYTRIGSIDLLLEWLNIVLQRSTVEQVSVIRTEILSSVLESLFIVQGKCAVEIGDHMKDCLEIDILDQETIELHHAINCLYIGILRAFKINFPNDYKIPGTDQIDKDCSAELYKDIYIWEHGNDLQSIKAPYPDSLLTRLNSSNDKHSIKQVTCSQTELIVINIFGHVKSRTTNNKDFKTNKSIKDLLNQKWSPLQFPDLKCKIEQISIGWPTENENQHVLALNQFGQVFSWGGGSFGRLGHGDMLDRSCPTLIKSLSGYKIKNVSCGSNHTSAVSETGLIFVWGNAVNFNGTENEICLNPKRLKQGIMSDIICGSYSTVLVSINKRNIYYLGSQYLKNKLFSEDFVLQQFPQFLEGLPFRKCDKNKSISKVVVHSSGILVLINDGDLYSIGYGLVLGCPNCQIHKTFEPVKSMSGIRVLDVALSETHVVVLSQNVIYSWSLTGSVLVLVQESFSCSLTNISSAWLPDLHKQINIAWSKPDKSSCKSSDISKPNENPYLCISSLSNSTEQFHNILNTSLDLLPNLKNGEQIIFYTLKLLLKCFKSLPIVKISSECENIKEKITKLITILVHIGDCEEFNTQIKKTVYSIIKEICSLSCIKCDDKADYICEILESNCNSSFSSLSMCNRHLLRNLILSFNDESKEIQFVKLFQLPFPKLDTLLISICKSLSNHSIWILQRKMFSHRSESYDSFINDLYTLLHQFSTVGYRICFSLLHQEKNDSNSPVGNLCSLLPLTNSIIDCLKSFFKHISKSQKISQWMKTNGNEINLLLLNTPISWILLDVLNYLLNENQSDIFPLTPHLERLIVSLDSINILLPKTTVNDTQEMQWPLFGFSGCPNISNVVTESGNSWLWLLDLQRLTGLVLGKCFKKELCHSKLNENSDDDKVYSQWLESSLFRYISAFPAKQDNKINKIKEFSIDFNRFLKLVTNPSTNFTCSESSLLYSTGLKIFATVIHLSNSKCCFDDRQSLSTSILIYKTVWKIIEGVKEYLETQLGDNFLFIIHSTENQDERCRNYIEAISMKCNFLISQCKSSFQTHSKDEIYQTPSILINSLDLDSIGANVTKWNIQNSKLTHSSERDISQKSFSDKTELKEFLKEVEEDLLTFLVSDNLSIPALDNDVLESTKTFLKSISFKIYFKKKSIDRISKTLSSLNKLLNSLELSIDSVLIQILNSMLVSPLCLVEQLNDSHHLLLEKIFSQLIQKLNKSVLQDTQSINSQRFCVSIINFLSSYNFGFLNLLNILIDGNFLYLIICFINNQLFISSGKWLIIEGDGDNNLPNVCNLIGWCIFENFILNICSCEKYISRERMLLIESQLRHLILQHLTEITKEMYDKLFGLNSLLNLISYFYTKSQSFKLSCNFNSWVKILLAISTHVSHLQRENIFYSKYSLNLTAINFLFSMMVFEVEQEKEEFQRESEISFTEIFQKFSDLFHYLISKSSDGDIIKLTNSINSRLNFYKHINEDLDDYENTVSFKWTNGNSNFDKRHSFKCQFETSDKVSLSSVPNSEGFLALNCEDLKNGIWRFTFDIECKDPVDFIYGFISNNTVKCQTNHISFMKQLKSTSSVSTSFRSTISRKLSCVIDMDQRFVYFTNGNNNIQTFTFDGVFYRFFIYSLNNPNPFQIQMISVKQLCSSEMVNNIEFYNNPLLAPDHYALFAGIYFGFNRLFSVNSALISEYIIKPLVEQSDCFKQFELFFDKNISLPNQSNLLIFCLFLLNDTMFDNGFYRGGTCYIKKEHETFDQGIILDFKIKNPIQTKGLNFVDKLTKACNIHCDVYTLSLNKCVQLPLDQLVKHNDCKKSQFLKMIEENILNVHETISFLSTLFTCLPPNYFDVDLTNYEEIQWSSELTECLKIDYYLLKCLYSRFLMHLLSSKCIINIYLENNNDKNFKVLEKVFTFATSLSTKPSPLRETINTFDFQSITYKLIEFFYQIYIENEGGLSKKFAHLFLEKNHIVDLRGHLNKREKKMILEVLKKQPCGQNLIERFTTISKDDILLTESRAVTFSDRRRRIFEYPQPIPMHFLQNQVPATEYDSNLTNSTETVQEQENVLLLQNINEISAVDLNQRSMDEFVSRSGNKNKRVYNCPVCSSTLKYNVQPLFSHLSLKHPLNCRKTFQHRASCCIKSDGSLSDLQNSTFYCASITSFGYCVCDGYLKNKISIKSVSYPSEDMNSFINENGYIHNHLIGLSGTLMTEHYCYPKISEISLSEDIRPKLDQIKIIGDHIHQEVNYSQINLDCLSNQTNISDHSLMEEIHFICQLNSAAIIKSLHRLEYASLIVGSRNIIIELAKCIFQRFPPTARIILTKPVVFNDSTFVINILRLFEGGRLKLNEKCNQISNSIRCVDFKNSDFLTILVLGLESSFVNDEAIHKFMVSYIENLENFLTSNKDFFDLNDNFEASILIRPSALITQLLFNTVIKVLSFNFCSRENYQYWQNEVEQIVELLAFGIISKNTISKVKIWCLHNQMKMFQLIQSASLPKVDINMVDLCDDLSVEDSPSIHLVNCNATVKKLISIANRHNILTADCEGTIRLWDIDFILGNEQNLRQTFLFSLGDEDLNNTSSKSSYIIENCLKMIEPLRVDLSNYLIQCGIQNIAASPNGIFIAESLGVYLNIWNTRSLYSKPYITSFASLITSLIFPLQTFGGLHGCLVQLLLVGLADGEIFLLRIFDNGTRVTQQQIPDLTSSNVTIVAWNEESNHIAIGYHDGSIILTDQNGSQVTLESVHNNRILNLLYCPYTTQFENNLLISSSVNESKIAVWNNERLLCVISLPASVSCMEWLPKKIFHQDNHYVIIAGTSTGLIQFWQINNSGDPIGLILTFCGHLCEILKLKVSESTNLLVSGCGNGWVNVWSINDQLLISTCRGDGSVIGIEWTPQNNLIAAFSRSNFIKVWRYFNNKSLEKSGIKQWAHIRKILVQFTKTKSIKHLKFLKHFSLSLHKLLNEQFSEELDSVKAGFSIVYSQYLQILIHYTIFLKFIPILKSSSVMEPLDKENKSLEMVDYHSIFSGTRALLTHYLNLNDNNQSIHKLDWLFNIDVSQKITEFICFEKEISLDVVPKWWWIWCIGSDEHIHTYLQSKWKNNYWSMDKQIELYQWYQDSPKYWIKEFSDSTYVWGCGKKGELGFPTNSEWVKPTLIKADGIQQIICGSGVTLILDCQGKLSACGEGLEVIFNPFMKEESYRIINVPILNDYKITHVAASCGPESHIIAITSFGEAFSWGIGSHGKLGHGLSTTLKKPKLIETLRGKGAIMSACGHDHSAVITSAGELFTFGLGSSGQLGITNLTFCDTPHLVTLDDKIGFVACGMNHTLALSFDGIKVFSFGKGTYGKLGVGDFEDHFTPKSINFQKFKKILKVVCGKNFSAALTVNGNVLTWGHADFLGICEPELNELELNETSKKHLPYPSINHLLSTAVIIDINAGNDTIFAITTTGVLYGWGSNTDNLLRLGNNPHSFLPEIISVHKNIHLKQISCGRHHVSASSHAPYSYRNNIPTGPQLNHDTSIKPFPISYPSLSNSEFTMVDMTARLILLLFWNETVRLTWQFWIPQTNQHYDPSDYDMDNHKYYLQSLNNWPIINSNRYIFPRSSWNWEPFNNFCRDDVRKLVNRETISSSLYRYLNGSSSNNRAYSSLVRIDRIDKKESVFFQTCRQVLKMDAAELRLPWRAWKVKLVNEGADDAGGAYDETISEMCNELEREDLYPKILLPIPNDTSTFIPNPDSDVPSQYFQFLGILMASAIRTKKPIDLHLDPLFWKRLTKSTVTVDDLLRIDPTYFNSLLSMIDTNILDNSNIEEIYAVDKFTCYNINVIEAEVIYKGSCRRIDNCNLSDFVNSCIYYRLHEFDNIIEHVRKGFCAIAPIVLLDIMSWKQLEKLICGSKTISIDSLKDIARYVDADEHDIIFTWFWEILESFTESEKSLFLRFVTGKSRLPSQDSHIPFRLFIYISKQSPNSLPQSQTCFNQIRLPRYNSRSDMESRLRIAINQCRSIDMDDYMLIRNREN